MPWEDSNSALYAHKPLALRLKPLSHESPPYVSIENQMQFMITISYLITHCTPHWNNILKYNITTISSALFIICTFYKLL